jgi:hypothetical protein
VIDAPQQTAWYVYGVVQRGDPATAPAVTGIADAPLELVELDALAAIVSGVDRESFSEDALAAKLNDRAWLEDAVRAHERVLEAYALAAPVVPLRFGAIYHARDDVEGLLAQRQEQFERDLAFVRDRTEYGVKVWAREAVHDEPQVASTGRAYLERRLAEQTHRETASEQLRTFVRSAHERIAEQSVAAVVNRPQPRELTGRSEPMVLNAAYLVERGGVGAFEAAVEAVAADAAGAGAAVELNGPWPPHNFVGADEVSP